MAAPSSSNSEWEWGTRGVIAEKWILGSNIGRGGYGTVLYGLSRSSGDLVAVKVASGKDTNMRHLETEEEVYIALDEQQGNGFPSLIHIERDDMDRPVAMVLNLLGMSLQTIGELHGIAVFSTGNCFHIGIQLLDRLEILHGRGYVHCDISTKNILLGRNDNLTVASNTSVPKLYLIDFGLACALRGHTRRNNTETGPEQVQGTIGNRHVCSINAHCMEELTGWDDLESVGYLLVLLHKGVLPWVLTDDEESHLSQMQKSRRTWESKENTSTESLAEGMGEEMKEFLGIVRDRNHIQGPDYRHLRTIFRRGIDRLASDDRHAELTP